MSEQSIRTQVADVLGSAKPRSSPQRNPPHSIRADQHCTHFRRLLWVTSEKRFRSAAFNVKGRLASPPIFSAQVPGSGAATGLNSMTLSLKRSGLSDGMISLRPAPGAADKRGVAA